MCSNTWKAMRCKVASFPMIPANTTWEPPTLKYFKWTYKALDGQTPAYRATLRPYHCNWLFSFTHNFSFISWAVVCFSLHELKCCMLLWMSDYIIIVWLWVCVLERVHSSWLLFSNCEAFCKSLCFEKCYANKVHMFIQISILETFSVFQIFQQYFEKVTLLPV